MKKTSNSPEEAILAGEVALLPTDTVYGLFADAFNPDAVRKIYEIKGRDFQKPLQVFFLNLKDVKKYALIRKKDEEKIKKMLPGPFTVILKLRAKYRDAFSFLSAGTIGARVVNNACVKQAVKKCGPLAATSANFSGAGSPVRFRDISPAIIKACAFAVKNDAEVSGKASTVIDTTKNMDIIRK